MAFGLGVQSDVIVGKEKKNRCAEVEPFFFFRKPFLDKWVGESLPFFISKTRRPYIWCDKIIRNVVFKSIR